MVAGVDAMDAQIYYGKNLNDRFVLSMAEDERVSSASIPSYFDETMRTSTGAETIYKIRNGMKGTGKFVIPTRLVHCSPAKRPYHIEARTKEFSVPESHEHFNNTPETALTNAPVPKEAMVYYIEFTQKDPTNLDFFFGLTGIKKSDKAPWERDSADVLINENDSASNLYEKFIRKLEFESLRHSEINEVQSSFEETHSPNESKGKAKQQMQRTEIQDEDGGKKILFSSRLPQQEYKHRVLCDGTWESEVYDEGFDPDLEKELLKYIKHSEKKPMDPFGYIKHKYLCSANEPRDEQNLEGYNIEHKVAKNARKAIIYTEYEQEINKALSRKYAVEGIKNKPSASQLCESISEMCSFDAQGGGYRRSLFEVDGKELETDSLDSHENKDSIQEDVKINMTDERSEKSMIEENDEIQNDKIHFISKEGLSDMEFIDGFTEFIDPHYLSEEEYGRAIALRSAVKTFIVENSCVMNKFSQQKFIPNIKHLPCFNFFWRQRKYEIEQIAFDDDPGAQNPSFYFQPGLGVIGNNKSYHDKKVNIDFPVQTFGILLDRYTQEVKFTINGLLLEHTCKLNEYADHNNVHLFPFITAYKGEFKANFGDEYSKDESFLFDVKSYARINRKKNGAPLFDEAKFKSPDNINSRTNFKTMVDALIDQYLILWGNTQCGEKRMIELSASRKLASVIRNYQKSGDLSQCADECEGTALEENKQLMAALVFAQLMEVAAGRAECSDRDKLASRIYEYSASLPPEIVEYSIELLLSGRPLTEQDMKLYHPQFYSYVYENLRSDIATTLKFELLGKMHEIAPQEVQESFSIPVPLSMKIDNQLLEKLFSIYTADLDEQLA